MSGYPRPGAGVPPAAGLTWRLLAACRGEEHLFFGPDGESRTARDLRVARAVAVCSGCPVRIPCAEFAASFQVRFGVWSGEDRERTSAAAPEGVTVRCAAGLHWMTPENAKPVAGTDRTRCRECLRIADRRTRAARHARLRQARREARKDVAA
jgi:WhiB family redox-sensing transcriptional regulator